MARPLGVKPILAITREGAIYYSRIYFFKGCIVYTQALYNTGTVALQESVSPPNHLVKDFPPFRNLQVEQDAPLIALVNSAKTKFNSIDYGVIAIDTAIVAD